MTEIVDNSLLTLNDVSKLYGINLPSLKLMVVKYKVNYRILSNSHNLKKFRKIDIDKMIDKIYSDSFKNDEFFIKPI